MHKFRASFRSSPRTPNSPMPPPMIHVLCFPPGKIVRASLNLRFSVKKKSYLLTFFARNMLEMGGTEQYIKGRGKEKEEKGAESKGKKRRRWLGEGRMWAILHRLSSPLVPPKLLFVREVGGRKRLFDMQRRRRPPTPRSILLPPSLPFSHV